MDNVPELLCRFNQLRELKWLSPCSLGCKLEEHASGKPLKSVCLSYRSLSCHMCTLGNWEEDDRTVSGFQALQLETSFCNHFLPLKSVFWQRGGGATRTWCLLLCLLLSRNQIPSGSHEAQRSHHSENSRRHQLPLGWCDMEGPPLPWSPPQIPPSHHNKTSDIQIGGIFGCPWGRHSQHSTRLSRS